MCCAVAGGFGNIFTTGSSTHITFHCHIPLRVGSSAHWNASEKVIFFRMKKGVWKLVEKRRTVTVKINQNLFMFLEGKGGPCFVEIIVKTQNGPHQRKVLCTMPVHHALIVRFASFLPTNHGRVSIFHSFFFFKVACKQRRARMTFNAGRSYL